MSYSHPVLTTTIVSLPGPHVSHHQWDPNVADKIISWPLCCNHIPPLFQILLCLPLLGESLTETTTSLSASPPYISLPFLAAHSPLATSKIPALLGLTSIPGMTSWYYVFSQQMFIKSGRHFSRHWNKTEDGSQQSKI